jgi:hypothetical protein
MPGRVRVEIDQIEEAGALVCRARGHLEDAPAAGPVEVQHERLDRALAHFGERWGRGTSVLVRDLDETEARLVGSARAYREADDHLASLARRVIEHLDPSTAIGPPR